MRSRATSIRVFCPDCGGRTTVVRNEFYGTGLAVSPSIQLCHRCDWVQLVRRTPDDDPAVDDLDEVALPGSRVARLLERWGLRRRSG
jgi:hypothetical protein